MDNAAKLRLYTRLSVLIIVIGVALMIMMIVTEDEPGAIPLLLIALGTGWYFTARFRNRPQQK